jgi:hypothetical protein
VCTLAAEVTVPAITFELGRNLALSLADLHGRGASLREIVMSRP